jgi:uncharacterized protein
VIFIDSNIPMYLVGAAHPLKDVAQRRLRELIDANERLVTDAEVLQEMLHRYAAIERLDAIQPAYDALLGVVDEVFAIERTDVVRAKEILMGARGSARDALHVAVMTRWKTERILSFDRDFDRYPGIYRLGQDR